MTSINNTGENIVEKIPSVAPSAYLDENAVVTGDVAVGEDCSIWPGAVVRGDMSGITIGARSNIQDNSVLHTDRGNTLTIGKNVTVGHACVLHGCTVQDGALVGMGSIVLDGAILEEGCMVGAGSLVTKGTVIPAGMLALGRPAKVVRPLTTEEKQANLHNAQEYVDLKDSALNR